VNFKLLLSFLLILLAFLAYWITGSPLYNYLSFNHPTEKAGILLTEGWFKREELKVVSDTFKSGGYSCFIATGIPLSKEYMMAENGKLDFRLNPPKKQTQSFQLCITARGTLPGKNAAIFEVFINDRKLGTESASIDPTVYSYLIEHIDTVYSVSIRFLNDDIINGENRDMFVSSISLDGVFYTVNDTNVYYQVLTRYDSTIYRSAYCEATVVKNVMKEYGIKSAQIIPVCTETRKWSKTLSTAINTVKQIDAQLQPDDSCSLNIISVANHARRTYAAYKKAAPSWRIGIISIDMHSQNNPYNHRLKNLKELFGILLIKILPL
jgi:hypothetical protein